MMIRRSRTISSAARRSLVMLCMTMSDDDFRRDENLRRFAARLDAAVYEFAGAPHLGTAHSLPRGSRSLARCGGMESLHSIVERVVRRVTRDHARDLRCAFADLVLLKGPL